MEAFALHTRVHRCTHPAHPRHRPDLAVGGFVLAALRTHSGAPSRLCWGPRRPPLSPRINSDGPAVPGSATLPTPSPAASPLVAPQRSVTGPPGLALAAGRSDFCPFALRSRPSTAAPLSPAAPLGLRSNVAFAESLPRRSLQHLTPRTLCALCILCGAEPLTVTHLSGR